MSFSSLLDTDSGLKWKKVGIKKRSGLLAPLFSVYSRKSQGIGDLEDLKLLADWAKVTGNSIIQLLPMNASGALSCPYDSSSSFALDPVYLRVRDQKSSAIPDGYLDYGIRAKKMLFLREAYDKDERLASSAFKNFRRENDYWLADFALYQALKGYHCGLAWWDWEDKYKDRQEEALADFCKKHEKEINFQIYAQWLTFEQFVQARLYARSQGVFLKGDLPILVSRDSADVWSHREFFKLEFASGAPPDMYCAKGQRWGMPTYNWDVIAHDGYRYLKEKLKYAQNFYDILRIDHVIGLFRIWSIPYEQPLENQGLNGFFEPADESKWEGQGREIISVILKNTDMLLCAEDLGVIPQICPKVLAEFGILGNDVQRWMKDWNIRHDFLGPEDYRSFSVAMLSTHDTTNWPAWWENEAGTVDHDLFVRKCNERGIDYNALKEKLFDNARCRHGRLRWLNNVSSLAALTGILNKKKEEIADFIDLYENTYQEKEKLWRHLSLNGPMREKSDKEIVRAALGISLESGAIFCVNTIIDWLYLADIFKNDPYQYRINTPGTISDKNWSLTLPLPLEELLKHKVNKDIRRMILASGRI
jgi:4-alpha-glucanotransferase